MARDTGPTWAAGGDRLEPFLPPELAGLEVVINHRRTGFRVRLSDTDRIELWRGPQPIAELAGSLVRELIAHHLTTAAIQIRMLEASWGSLGPAPADAPLRADARPPEVTRLALPRAGLSEHLTRLAHPVRRRRDAKQGKHVAVGAKIRGIRTRLGLTQRAFAKQTGVGLMTILRAENGQAVPRPEALQKIAAAGATLGVSIEWLLGGSTNERRL